MYIFSYLFNVDIFLVFFSLKNWVFVVLLRFSRKRERGVLECNASGSIVSQLQKGNKIEPD